LQLTLDTSKGQQDGTKGGGRNSPSTVLKHRVLISPLEKIIITLTYTFYDKDASILKCCEGEKNYVHAKLLNTTK